MRARMSVFDLVRMKTKFITFRNPFNFSQMIKSQVGTECVTSNGVELCNYKCAEYDKTDSTYNSVCGNLEFAGPGYVNYSKVGLVLMKTYTPTYFKVISK